LKIHALGEEAEARLGDHFDIRAFHDIVLGSGSVPLGALDANVHSWLASEEQVARR
jgi:uncharacterized protein (DUF885 family)